MRRVYSSPRVNWQADVEKIGFMYHTIDGDLYWDESGWYEFSLSEINHLEQATNCLHDLCLKAVQSVIDDDRLDEFKIPKSFQDWVSRSWESDEPSIYGRFDLAWDGQSEPKMLEYNADTPTGLFEASVVQWKWLESVHPHLDQFNSIHEHLIGAWSELRKQTSYISFAATDGHEEDFGNVSYLQDTAAQAGLSTNYLDMSAIGYDSKSRRFVDLANVPVEWMFKLYPWEWMLQEPFAPQLLTCPTHWIEPAWKMLLSNKALLVVLWEMFPDCPYLLPSYWEAPSGDYVSKPILAREGSNIQMVCDGQIIGRTEGPYSEQPTVFQQYHPLAQCDTGFAVLGSWVVDGAACGLGIREDENPITHNLSRFVPHLIR